MRWYCAEAGTVLGGGTADGNELLEMQASKENKQLALEERSG